MTNAFLTADFERKFVSGMSIQATFSMPVDSYSVTALVGPSGCGKTTILRCLAGLDVPDRGRIAWGTEVWFDASGRIHRNPQARHVGYLVQEYALFPHLTVAGNVGYGLTGLPLKQRHQRVGELLQRFGLAGLQDRLPAQLSGGQQQRLCIARTVAIKPEVILFDEPCSALDPISTAKIEELIDELKTEYTIAIVTHNMQQATRISDDTAFFYMGELIESGPTRKMFTMPKQKRTEDYVTGRFG